MRSTPWDRHLSQASTSYLVSSLSVLSSLLHLPIHVSKAQISKHFNVPSICGIFIESTIIRPDTNTQSSPWTPITRSDHDRYDAQTRTIKSVRQCIQRLCALTTELLGPICIPVQVCLADSRSRSFDSLDEVLNAEWGLQKLIRFNIGPCHLNCPLVSRRAWRQFLHPVDRDLGPFCQ